MLQLIKKLFSTKKQVKKAGKGKDNRLWAERQIREMAKLGGRLVLQIVDLVVKQFKNLEIEETTLSRVMGDVLINFRNKFVGHEYNPPKADWFLRQKMAFQFIFWPEKRKKKKQHYRYSQSRWNTYSVVSSTSKLKLFGAKVKFGNADDLAKIVQFSLKMGLRVAEGAGLLLSTLSLGLISKQFWIYLTKK